MQIINISSGGMESGLEGAVIAIGNFDGVHKGHAEIIKQVIAKAKELKKPAGILTFNPSPYTFFLHKEDYQITPFAEKANILDGLGLDFVAYAPFTEDFSKITADDFVKDILGGKMKVSHVFTGEDFKFGHKALGNAKLLAELSGKYGFGYTPVAKILSKDGKRYSSSEAVRLIENGDVAGAEAVLGRKFYVAGQVQEGKKLARGLGFPTANLKLDGYIKPKYGVYECVVRVRDGKKLGTGMKAICNVGVKPTYGDNKPLLEAHILNFSGDLYIKNILVELVRFIREEKKFDSVDELKKQIEKDVENVR